MKHLKCFEDAFDLMVGDIIKVTCRVPAIYSFDGQMGKVIDIEKGYHSANTYAIKLLRDFTDNSGNHIVYLSNHELTRATPEELKQYELEQDVKKYNL